MSSTDAAPPPRPTALPISRPTEFAGEIPIFDLSDYLAGKPGTLEELSRQITWASEHVGFYFVRGANLEPLPLIPRMFELSERLHRLPAEKLRALDIKNMKKPHVRGGYQDNAAFADGGGAAAGDKLAVVQEFLEKGNPAGKFDNKKFTGQGTYRFLAMNVGHGGQDWGENQFPAEEDIPGFRKTTEAYEGAVFKLVRALLPVYAHALGMPELELLEYFRDPRRLLTMNYYAPRPHEHLDWNGLAMHADCIFFALLAQDGVEGLQLMLPTGDWVKAPAPTDCLLVNTGEFLMRLTNGKWLNTVHKVVPPHDRDRYSVGFFLTQDKHCVLAPLPQFCSEASPPAYEPFSYASFMRSGETPFTVGAVSQKARLGGVSAVAASSARL